MTRARGKIDHSVLILLAIGAFLVFMVWLVVARSPDAIAATAEEKAAFMAQQRREKTAFELQMLGEQDSKAAARRAFDDKARAERAAFTASLRSTSPGEKKQLMNGYNARARQAKLDFEAKLPGEKPNDLEKRLADFDKTSNRSAAAQIQRSLIVEQAKKEQSAKLAAFKRSQLDKLRAFNET